MANQYAPYLVYTYLPAFLRHRGLIAAGEPLRQAGRPASDEKSTEADARDTIIPLLVRFGYYRVDARRASESGGVRDTVVILLLAPESKYAHHSGDLRGLISSLDSDKKLRRAQARDRLHEVIVIAAAAVLSKKNLTDVICNFRESAVPGPPFYNLYPYRTFATVIPEAAAVPRHRLMPAQEAREYMRRERLSATDLPRILASDPPLVWLGARAGDYVEIERASETACQATVVRLVVKGVF